MKTTKTTKKNKIKTETETDKQRDRQLEVIFKRIFTYYIYFINIDINITALLKGSFCLMI